MSVRDLKCKKKGLWLTVSGAIDGRHVSFDVPAETTDRMSDDAFRTFAEKNLRLMAEKHPGERWDQPA